MARWRGLWGGAGALALIWLSVQLLSRMLMRLPWTSLASQAAPPQPVAPVFEDVAGAERALTPGKRTVSGSVPLYREARPQPRWAPIPAEPEPVARAAAIAPSGRPQPAKASAAPASRFHLDALPALGEAFGAAPAGGQHSPQAAAAGPAQTGAAPYREPEPEDAPSAGGWDQGPTETAAPAKRARVMRAVPQSGSVPQPKPAEEEPEDDQ